MKRVWTVLALGGIFVAVAAGAAEVRFFRLSSRADFLAGTPDGVGIDSLGTLRLADRVERFAEVDEPFLFALAAHPEGFVVGTGNQGRVLLVDRRGKVRRLLAAEEPEIFALWVDPDGTVFAGSSPDGKVYRIRGDSAEVFFDPGETYIWALARSADGSLLVATGTEGRLYTVDAEGKGRVLYDADDTHLRCLEVLEDGSVLLGTAGEGLILSLAPDGTARALHDATFPEVVALTRATDGSYYAAVLNSEASVLEGAQPLPKRKEEDEGTEGPEASVRVLVQGQEEGIARVPRGPRSEILRISASGLVESVWTFEQETVYDLLWERGRLWVATGLEGKLFSFRDDSMVLEKDVDERQIVALVPGPSGPVFGTTNAAALYRAGKGTERRGTYTSAALDAGQFATFGTLRWYGTLPPGAQARFSVRSGMSAEPDRTWSAWTEADRGEEVRLGGLPAGRYLQWRVELVADGGSSPVVSQVAISYRQRNVPPKVESFTVLDPGVVLVAPGFNPSNQAFEPMHPNREGIFTSLGDTRPKDERQLKRLWKKGYRTLRWKVTDSNADPLTFELGFRREGDTGWLPMADALEESHYAFDSTALPDGIYRFRLRASDAEGNEAGETLVTEAVSEPVLVDHTPPRLETVRWESEGAQVLVQDSASPLRRAEYSVDAREWTPARSLDGLLDARRETLVLPVNEPYKLLLLRVMDAAFNVATFDLGPK